MSLVAPIPPATISFHGTAIVHAAGSPQARSLLKELGSRIPTERRGSACLIEIVPEGEFLTYGVDVPLRKMLDPGRGSGTRVCDAGVEETMIRSRTDPKTGPAGRRRRGDDDLGPAPPWS